MKKFKVSVVVPVFNAELTIENLIKIGNIKKLKPNNFKKFGSARKLYNFNIDNVSEY